MTPARKADLRRDWADCSDMIEVLDALDISEKQVDVLCDGLKITKMTSMKVHAWFEKVFGEQVNGKEFDIKFVIAELDIASLRGQLAEANRKIVEDTYNINRLVGERRSEIMKVTELARQRDDLHKQLEAAQKK